MMEPAREEAARKGAAKETRKRPYAPPRLTVHGDVKELTKVLRLVVTKASQLSRELMGPDD